MIKIEVLESAIATLDVYRQGSDHHNALLRLREKLEHKQEVTREDYLGATLAFSKANVALKGQTHRALRQEYRAMRRYCSEKHRKLCREGNDVSISQARVNLRYIKKIIFRRRNKQISIGNPPYTELLATARALLATNNETTHLQVVQRHNFLNSTSPNQVQEPQICFQLYHALGKASFIARGDDQLSDQLYALGDVYLKRYGNNLPANIGADNK